MIGYYVHHHGIGHRTRFGSVAGRLRSPVTGISSMHSAGWPGPWLQLARDDEAVRQTDGTSGDHGARPGLERIDPTAHVLHWVPRHDAGLGRRAAQLTSWLDRTRPALMVVDVSVEVALLSRLSGIPVVVVALPGTRADRAHRTAYDLADALLAPWPPGAHTKGWPAVWRAKLWAVGGISRFDGHDPTTVTAHAAATSAPGEPGQRRRRVLLLWGAGGRGVPAAEVFAARVAAPEWEWLERSPESPSPDLWADLCSADVVVTHGGQNAVADVAAARRPAVVVAQPRPFDEQVATADAVDRLGLAVGLRSWPADATAWPGILERAVSRGGKGWDRWSSGNGAGAAARLLDGLATQLMPDQARPIGQMRSPSPALGRPVGAP
ncbi:glycosyltransferase [Monashia sp. NPDC004114]